jgi:hypothetical protein
MTQVKAAGGQITIFKKAVPLAGNVLSAEKIKRKKAY